MELGHRAVGIDHWLTRLRNRYPVFDPIARMLDHAISGSETRGPPPPGDCSDGQPRSASRARGVPNSKDNPPLAASEQRTNRYVNEVGNR